MSATHEIWVRMPDGEEGRAAFAGVPEVYESAERAQQYVDRYEAEQVGWNVPEEQRKQFWVREVPNTKKTDVERDTQAG